MTEKLFVVPTELLPKLQFQCVCLGSDMRGCSTCEGVGIMTYNHVFGSEKGQKKRRIQLWDDLAGLGLPRSDVDIWPINVKMELRSQTAPTGIRLTHTPTGLSVSCRTRSGTRSLIMAAEQLYKGLRKAQELDLR